MQKNCNSQIIFYAKHWFLETDVIEDLKILFGGRNGIEPRHMQINDIVSCLLDLTLGLILENDDLRQRIDRMKDFLADISPENCWKVGYLVEETPKMFVRKGEDPEKYEYHRAVIRKCLSVLRLTKASEIGELDPPDYRLLPKKENAE